MQALKINPCSKLVIFENDEDVLNLAELLTHISCAICPSTGTIHLASNLQIPTIGLYAKDHVPLWETKDKRYIFLDKPISQLTPQEEQKIIKQTLKMLIELLPSLRPFSQNSF